MNKNNKSNKRKIKLYKMLFYLHFLGKMNFPIRKTLKILFQKIWKHLKKIN